MYYTYSRHSSYQRAMDALEGYYSTGEVCESEFPRIHKEAGRWLVQFWDSSNGKLPALEYRI